MNVLSLYAQLKNEAVSRASIFFLVFSCCCDTCALLSVSVSKHPKSLKLHSRCPQLASLPCFLVPPIEDARRDPCAVRRNKKTCF